MAQDNTRINTVTKLLFVIYLLALCWILLFKLGVQFSYMEERRVNLIPFNGAARISGEVIMNIIIFVPLGIYVGVLFKRWISGTKIIFFFVSSFLFEAFQFIFKVGAFDITDIISNTLGGLTGLLIFQVISKLFSNTLKAQHFINIIAATGTVLMMTLLLLLKLNILPVKYR
ncbi:MAG: VanZ family protein [Agriterribacter sp.]